MKAFLRDCTRRQGHYCRVLLFIKNGGSRDNNKNNEKRRFLPATELYWVIFHFSSIFFGIKYELSRAGIETGLRHFLKALTFARSTGETTMGQNQVVLRHLILHFPSSGVSERCERTSEQTSEWPSIYVPFLAVLNHS